MTDLRKSYNAPFQSGIRQCLTTLIPKPDIDLELVRSTTWSQVFNFRIFFLFGLNCGNCRFRAKYAEMAGPWRDWGRLRLTKNGGGRNNSICGNLPLEHPPPIWVVPGHQDDDQEDDDHEDPDDHDDDDHDHDEC